MIDIKFLEILFELIWHLAWPATILLIVYIFRKPIAELIKRIKKISSGDKSIELEELGKAAQQQLENSNLQMFDVTEETIGYDEYLDLMEEYALSSNLLIGLVTVLGGQNIILSPFKKQLASVKKKLAQERPNSERVKILQKTSARLEKYFEKKENLKF